MSSSSTCTYATDGGDLVIEFDYQPSEDSTDVSPGCPESVDVLSVMAGPFEIIDWLSKSAIQFFEEKALESMQQAKFDADYDRADEAYQSRKDDELMGLI